MGPEPRENSRKDPTRKPQQSWVDKATGQHTNTIIAFILFLVVLIPLIIVLFVDDSFRKEIITALITLLSAFGGFVVGERDLLNKK